MIKIIEYENRYLTPCCKLISDTYKEFNHDEGSKEAVEQYVSYYNPDITQIDILEKSFSRTPYCYLAIQDDNVIGIMRGFDGRIINLFVNKEFQNRGIARKLVIKFEEETIKNGITIIKLRASIYATVFYQKLGYKKTTGIRNFSGLKIQPMSKDLNL
ncbi:MAG: GNAT family N-acetyltransferase [Spirochaetaceae bacterium]